MHLATHNQRLNTRKNQKDNESAIPLDCNSLPKTSKNNKKHELKEKTKLNLKTIKISN